MRYFILLSVVSLLSLTTKKPARTIILQPYKDISNEYIVYVKNKLNVLYPNVIIGKPIDLPKESIFYGRYRADTLISYLSKTAKPGNIMVGITNKDITSFNGNNDNWGIFGLGYQNGNACCISTFRLSKNNKAEELFKTVLHELGHNEGLSHCPDQNCFMLDAKGKNKFNKEKDFCSKCKTYLKKKNWNLK